MYKKFYFFRWIQCNLDNNFLTIICPSLLVLTQNFCDSIACATEFFQFCHSTLLNYEKSRVVRKFGITFLKNFINSDNLFKDKEKALWTEFFVLINGLEEPQVIIKLLFFI